MKNFDWTKFTLKIAIKSKLPIIYNAWTRACEIEKWFLSECRFISNGEMLASETNVTKGCTYQWNWFLFNIYSLKKTVFNVEKENDLLHHNKKHSTAELERLHRQNNELKKQQSEVSSAAVKALEDKISEEKVPVVQLKTGVASTKNS